MFKSFFRLLKFVLIISVPLILAALILPLFLSTQPLPGLSTAHEVATPDSHFVTIPFPGTQGIEIHYLTGAQHPEPDDKTGFLLLHGFTFNAFTWNRQLKNFDQIARTIAYDQIPYGLSAKLTKNDWRGDNPYSKPAAVEHLFAVMDELKMTRAVLVGNSSGGTLALEAALAHPERVAGLILVAPWVLVNRPTVSEKVAYSTQLRRLSLFIAHQLGTGALLDYCYADSSRIGHERRVLTTIHNRVHNWDLAWAELLNRSLYSPVTIQEHLAEIRVPTLVISGDRDSLVPLADSRKVAGSLQNEEFAVLAGCGHVPQEECPEIFAQVVNQWLTRHPELLATKTTRWFWP